MLLYFHKIFYAKQFKVNFKVLNDTHTKTKSSQQRCSMKKAVLKNFAIFTGKHLCWSLFLIKLLAFRVFSNDVAKILKTPFLNKMCERFHLENNGFTIVLINLELRSHPVLVPPLLIILKSKYRYLGLFLNLQQCVLQLPSAKIHSYPFFTPKHTFFTSNNAIFDTNTHTHFFYTF